MSNRKFTETKDYTFFAFSMAYSFKVPPFQRTYEWKNKQINDLWESIISNDEEYFIGNIVCLDASESSDNRLEIIDGQQRLFTISLFLVAIRDLYKDFLNRLSLDAKEQHGREIEDRIRRIEDLLLFKSESEFYAPEILRMTPGKENLTEIYGGLVKSTFNTADARAIKDLDDNQIKFVRNYKTIKSLVLAHATTRTPEGVGVFEELNNLINKITHLLFIVIICKTNNDAYNIFEGLNSTGIGLSVADLLKNAVMQKVSTSRDTRIYIDDKWDELETFFEETKTSLFPKFLRHQWISREGYITTSKLFESIKKKRLRENNEVIKNYVKELLADAATYIALRFDGYESKFDRSLNRATLDTIEKFRMLDLDQVYELLLSFYNRHLRDKKYTTKFLNKDLYNLWVFSIRAKIMSINPSEYEKIFADYCFNISNKRAEMADISLGFKNQLTELVKNGDTFIEHFITDIRYSSDNKLLLYLLSCIMKKFDKTIMVASPTIEHILPLEPANWHLKRKDIEDYVNSVGNLTLLYVDDNRSLGNASMKEKVQRVYSKSKHIFNQQLSEKAKDFESDPRLAIEKRSLELAKIAEEIFSYR